MKNFIGFILSIVILLIVADLTWLICFDKPLIATKEENVYKGLLYDVYTCGGSTVKMKWEKFNCKIEDDQSSNGKESPYEVTTLKNVKLSINNVTSTGATISISDNNKETYTYGAWYKIEKFVDGKWYTLETIQPLTWNMVGYKPVKGVSLILSVDWTKFYGSLPNGKYRLLKEVDKKYIAVEFVIEMVSLSKVELVKNKSYPSFYNKYLVHDGRIIYLANNIDDVYVTSSKDKIKLSYYIAKSYQTFDDSIKSITDLLEETAIIRDGGSTVYKYKKYDITVVRCNNLNGNKNIYIGDYSANFDDEVMCK